MSTVTLDNKTILVTGAAGFIGSNLVKRIYQEAPSATVIGIDKDLIQPRLADIQTHNNNFLTHIGQTD